MLGTADRLVLLVLLSMAAGAPVAAADVPPPADLGKSTLECAALVNGEARPGDDVLCRLSVDVVTGFGYDATADITVPANTTYDPLAQRNYQGVADDLAHPASVHYGTSQLGFLTAGQPKTVQIQLHIRPDAIPGDAIAPVATVHVTNGPDYVTTASDAVVQPPPAVLTPSEMTCADEDGPPLRPADFLDCTARLVDLPFKEDATELTARVAVPKGAAWAAGGNESGHDADGLFWSLGAFPDGVPSGGEGPQKMRLRLRIDDDVVPGTIIRPAAIVEFASALSRLKGLQPIFAAGLVTAPGAAVLTASNLVCADADGAPLYPGDAVICVAEVADAALHEDVADLVGTAPVPGGTSAPGTPLDAKGRVVLDGQLGSVASGARRRATYALRVGADTAPGTVLSPTADVAGRSVGTNLPVGAHLVAAPLVVAARPVPAAPGAPVAAAATAGTAKPGATPAKATSSRICGSRRVVVVNVSPPKGRHWKSLTATFANKSVKGTRVGKKGSFRARLVFQGLPKGAIKVTLTGVTTKGRTVRSTRTYNLCTKKR